MNHSHQRGVTLVELLVAIAILTLVLSLGSVSFQSLIERRQQSQALTDLYHLFQKGRNSAITRGSMVTICPLDDHEVCSTDWNRPIQVFLDPANERELTNETEVLYTIPAPKAGHLDARPSWKSYFQFRRNGTSHGTLGNITYCPQSGDNRNAGRLLMNMGGRLRFARDRNGDGVVQGSGGDPVQCRD